MFSHPLRVYWAVVMHLNSKRDNYRHFIIFIGKLSRTFSRIWHVFVCLFCEHHIFVILIILRLRQKNDIYLLLQDTKQFTSQNWKPTKIPITSTTIAYLFHIFTSVQCSSNVWKINKKCSIMLPTRWEISTKALRWNWKWISPDLLFYFFHYYIFFSINNSIRLLSKKYNVMLNEVHISFI